MNGEDAGCLGTAEPDVLGCTDASANNFNADATADDGSCIYGIVFSGTFGGTVASDNSYLMPAGSEPWAGFANEDVSVYPFTFGDGGSVTFTGSTDGGSADVYFRFEANPYPNTEPSYNSTSVTLGAESAEYTIDIPSQEGNTFNSVLFYVLSQDVVVTLNSVTVNGSEYTGPVDVVGCMDANASNFNADANIQGYDQYGNLQCVYASCDDIPEDGCIYSDGFGAFNENFNADNCSSYGGTPCVSCNDEAVQWAGDQNGDGFLGFDSNSGQTFITVESYPNIGNASLTINGEDYEMGYSDWGANAHWYAGFTADPTVTYEWSVTVSTCAGGQTVSGTIEATEEPCSGSILTMTDSYGDGWNGAVLTINGVDYTVDGASAEACIDLLDCNTVTWTPGAWDSETSWSVGDLSGATVRLECWRLWCCRMYCC
ncbi:MAG: hypothetical protein CM15mP23_08970 [Cryomorphaceae bacterium]|nr:MAG: hypothetical protein CM15mP23_08970 [Cryomorphaceae bacterium]